MTETIPINAGVELDDRIASLVTRCIYEIATGVWAPGAKLPSVRQAETMWGLDRRAVMRAYQRLAELGLVEAVDRSGYYVARGDELRRVSKHRHELESHYDRIARQIVDETDLSALGIFRYFAQYAEQKARLSPEVAFAECTAAQAEGHAREVRQRLGVPCLSLTTHEIEGRRARIPAHVRTLLVTGFHYGELKHLDGDDLHVVPVPIEVSPDLALRLRDPEADIVIVEYDATEGEHIQRDVEQLDDRLHTRTRLCVTEDVNAALAEIVDGASPAGAGGVLAALSPRVWGDAEPRWREHPDVALIAFSITDEAWPRVADAIGLPLGDVGRA